MAIAEETVAAARAHGNPFLICFALDGYGRAFAQTDPARALTPCVKDSPTLESIE